MAKPDAKTDDAEVRKLAKEPRPMLLLNLLMTVLELCKLHFATTTAQRDTLPKSIQNPQF